MSVEIPIPNNWNDESIYTFCEKRHAQNTNGFLGNVSIALHESDQPIGLPTLVQAISLRRR